ncbi:Hsp70 family protein [Streptomyces sp. NPDC053542]|uniref:Hsp70 family protein n=1 Tax=Streptomyces sp. NPDC053542 TaxID=3365710 RepID=UPI0037D2254A
MRTEVAAPPALPAELLTPLRAQWAGADGRVVTEPTTVDSGQPMALPGELGATELPLTVRVHYHDLSALTGRPVRTIRKTLEVTMTLHLDSPQDSDDEQRGEARPATEPEGRRQGLGGTGPGGNSAAAAPTEAVPAGRVPQGAARHKGFAAVDFGTTNSTLTIHDMWQLELRPMSRHQEACLRRELAGVLASPPPTGAEAKRWRQLLHDVARQLMPGTADDKTADPGGALADALRGGYGGDAWLHRLYTALELRLAAYGEPLLQQVSPLLHACYDRAFAELPLDVLRLFPAELDQVGGAEIASRIEVLSTEPELRARMGEERISVTGTANGTPRAYRGLKQHLGRDEPMADLPARADGSPTTADDLIREGLRYLLDQGDEYIAANPKKLHQGKIDHVVMTYPTIAPPGVRRRLRDLVGAGADGRTGLGVTLVDTQFDEAVAAALFFIMRDFGGDFAAGVESFRSRCRVLAGGAAWQQNALTLDIGGGTTDLGLISLLLKDRTPTPAPRVDPRFTGRLYVLTPKLLGSTGHLQLGGDLMTLKLFRWYKSALADHLLQSKADRYERVVGSLKKPFAVDGRYVPGSLLHQGFESDDYPSDLVDMVLPTRWDALPAAERGKAEQTFWMLWRLAEEAKYELGRGIEEYLAPPDEVAAILARTGAADELGSDWSPLMDASVFEELLRPVVDEIMDLTVALAKGLDGRQLDRIFLTGKSSRMPLIRQALVERLNAEDDVVWNAAGIAVEEQQYAKLATSIGACWGHHVRRFAHTEGTARKVLERGRYVLRIEVDNLRYYLPCDFGATFQLAAGPTPTDSMLTSGTRLSPTGPRGNWAVRSEWERLPQSLVVHRGTGTGWIQWGAFDADAWVKQHEPGFELDMEQWANEVSFQVEVDADLFLQVHLCRGEPQYVVGGEQFCRVELPDSTVGGWEPMQIVVDTRVAGDRPDTGTVVFDLKEDPRCAEGRPEAGRPDPTAGIRFDQLFRTGEEEEAATFWGATSGRLGVPSLDGWPFYLRFPRIPDRRDELIDVVPVPAPVRGQPWQDKAEYVATLDERGHLAVHQAPVPYWEARSMADMWHKAGSVLRVEMDDVRAPRFAERDPFNGAH